MVLLHKLEEPDENIVPLLQQSRLGMNVCSRGENKAPWLSFDSMWGTQLQLHRWLLVFRLNPCPELFPALHSSLGLWWIVSCRQR